jgi:hypothetical protein
MIFKRQISKQLLTGGISLAAILAVTVVSAHALPVAVAPYTLSAFTGVPPSGATQPDDIAVSADGTDLWVGYGNGACTFGPGQIGINPGCPTGTPANSSLVEYEISSGTVLQNVSIPGHLDGLKVNPTTGDAWASQNEDGNPTLAIVNDKSGKFKMYTITSSQITGGFDDVVFAGPKSKTLYITASSQTDTTTPVIVSITGKPKQSNTVLTPVLAGAPTSVFNVATNTAETGDEIGDPDSMTMDPAGELVVCNRSNSSDSIPGGNSLFIARASGATNPILRVPLTENGTSVAVDDTIFTTSLTSGTSSTAGTIFITDTSANVVYTLSKPYFPPNEVYTAVTSTQDVDLLDMNTGIATPVVTGFEDVHGMAFSPTSVAIAPASKK